MRANTNTNKVNRMKEPSNELLLHIKSVFERIQRTSVIPSQVQAILEMKGYCNFRCGYIRDRFRQLGHPLRNNRT